MQKWEYKVFYTWLPEKALNALGPQGWELVSVAAISNGFWGASAIRTF